MNRLLAIVALLFGFSAVAGPAVAAARVQAPEALAVAMAEAGLGDACLETTVPAVKLFKACPKKLKTGAAVFCHQCSGVLPAAVDAAVPEELMRLPPDDGPRSTLRRAGERQFRPPRLLPVT